MNIYTLYIYMYTCVGDPLKILNMTLENPSFKGENHLVELICWVDIWCRWPFSIQAHLSILRCTKIY